VARSLEESIFAVAEAIRYLADRLSPGKPPQPQPFTLKLISERRLYNMDFLTYQATLPVVPAGTDIDLQSLVITVDGAATTQELSKEATTATFEVPQGSDVELSLLYVDDAGNASDPRTQSFVATDTIAPEAPGPFGEIKIVSERTE
jgi:hypothetical protein